MMLDNLSFLLMPAQIPFSGDPNLNALYSVLAVLLLSLACYYLGRVLLVKCLGSFISKTKSELDDLLVKNKVFQTFLLFIPPVVLLAFIPNILKDHPNVLLVLSKVLYLCMIVTGFLALNSLLDAFLDIYETLEASKEIPMKSFTQVIKVVAFLVTAILLGSVVINKNPVYLLSGLGALTAVLMLVFKDAILGFVAGIQLSANKMVAKGDWISMPQYGADGDVLEVALTTVKVQNWDKTITTIPTYALISNSFKNWRGMFAAGGRRIMRSIDIDMHSIKFCDEEMLKRYSKIQYIAEYLRTKREEIDEHNTEKKVDLASIVNGRHLTNVGTFRAYIVAYLRDHPVVNQEMSFLVRHLQPGPTGLPIQVYVFCKDTRWAYYEDIQADIFDHLLAAVPEFDLKVFQYPSAITLPPVQ